MSNIDETIARIQQKIKTNKINVNPVLNIEEINNFETKTKLKLPIILKRFYTEICNGCQMFGDFNFNRFNELRIDVEKAKRNFDFTDYWVWEDEYSADQNPLNEYNVDNDRLEKTQYGNIELINIGDGQAWNIILNGEEEGQMWFYTEGGIQPCFPQRSLLSWFEYWLDGNDDYFAEFVY